MFSIITISLIVSPSISLQSPNSASDFKNCECVPFYRCKDGVINTDGEGIIDLRMGEDVPCPDSLDICCNISKIQKETTTKPSPAENRGCGYRHPKGTGFQITGNENQEAAYGEFPWMVALLTVFHEKLIYHCGGALIHPKVVLTAAHCVHNKNIVTIRAGEWDFKTNKEIYPYQDVPVEFTIIHPLYQQVMLANDIALIFLKTEVQKAPHINTVCLPPQDKVVENCRCFASGWGKDVYGKKGKYMAILKKRDLPLVEKRTCEIALRRASLGPFFNLDQSFICAGGELGKDTCKGDGGSPLVCPIKDKKNRYFQIGIVSWGVGCGTTTPGVYVKVSKFRKWIDEQMLLHHLNTTSYEY